MAAGNPPSRKSSASKESLRAAGEKFAKKHIDKVFDGSAIQDRSDDFPQFDKSELLLGKVLGKGGFGTVYEVRGFDAGKKSIVHSRSDRNMQKEQKDDEVNPGEMESRKFIADHCIRNGGDARYAVKVLSKEVIDDPPTYIQGIMDMATETRVLSDTEHPNIIKLRAVAEIDPFNEQYFIVMDRLYDTMEKRLEQWDKRTKRTSGMAGKLFDRSGAKSSKIMEERMVAAFDLSAALDYLHKRGIIYRDLKPENIGFDIRNDVKIFDFGLAKELRDKDKRDDGLYNLTSMTGSPLYMAPEVATDKPYNQSCDVYSFAILFWQMMALKRPFELYTMKSLKTKVWSDMAKRPPVADEWPLPIKMLLRRAWNANIEERPTMISIYKILRKECVRCRKGDESGLEHNRRRSTFVFRGAREKAEEMGMKKAPTKPQPVEMDAIGEGEESDE